MLVSKSEPEKPTIDPENPLDEPEGEDLKELAKSLERMNKVELQDYAKSLGIEFVDGETKEMLKNKITELKG